MWEVMDLKLGTDLSPNRVATVDKMMRITPNPKTKKT
jgi:hypothetical protein